MKKRKKTPELEGRQIEIPDEKVKVGDFINLIGVWKRVTKIKPYIGPLNDIVFAVAETIPPGDVSLCYGGHSTVAR